MYKCENISQLLYIQEKHSSSWLGNCVRWFVVHEHVNIRILLSLLWDYVHTVVSSASRGECVATGGLYRPTHPLMLSSLAEWALMLRYRLPDGRSWKRLWEEWVGSFTVLLALLEHLVRKISRMEGRGTPLIFAAVFTVRWRVVRSAALQLPYQTVMQLVSTLSMVPL